MLYFPIGRILLYRKFVADKANQSARPRDTLGAARPATQETRYRRILGSKDAAQLSASRHQYRQGSLCAYEPTMGQTGCTGVRRDGVQPIGAEAVP
jgi:hypothetical protein